MRGLECMHMCGQQTVAHLLGLRSGNWEPPDESGRVRMSENVCVGSVAPDVAFFIFYLGL